MRNDPHHPCQGGRGEHPRGNMTDESKDTKPESRTEMHLREEGQIEFTVGDKVMLSIKEEGFFVQGRLVDSDRKVYEHFKEWLVLAGAVPAFSDTPTLDEIAGVLGKLMSDLESEGLTPRRSGEALLQTFAKALGSAFSGDRFALLLGSASSGDGFRLFTFEIDSRLSVPVSGPPYGRMRYVSDVNRDYVLRALQEHIERMRQGTDDTAGREPSDS